MTTDTVYRLPDYTSLVDNVEEYSAAWQSMAKPIEEALGITLSGFDPMFMFTKGNPNGVSTTITLPVWFVRDLNTALENK